MSEYATPYRAFGYDDPTAEDDLPVCDVCRKPFDPRYDGRVTHDTALCEAHWLAAFDATIAGTTEQEAAA